jgi:hypothetical protein
VGFVGLIFLKMRFRKKPRDCEVENRQKRSSGAKARFMMQGLMYGLKPVPSEAKSANHHRGAASEKATAVTHGALRHPKNVKMLDGLAFPGLKALWIFAHDFSSLKAAAPSVFAARPLWSFQSRFSRLRSG